MKSFLLGLFVLFLWAIPTRYYYVCKIKKQCDPAGEIQQEAPPRQQNLELRKGDTVLLDQYESFYFGPSSSAPQLSDNNSVFIDTLASLLLADSTQHLSITGYYRPTERHIRQGFFENLGLARADALRAILGRQGVNPDRIKLSFTESDLTEGATFELVNSSSAKPDSTLVE